MRTCWWRSVAGLPVVLVTAILGLAVCSPAAGDGSSFVSIAEEDATGITLHVRVPRTALAIDEDGEGKRRLRLGNLATTRRPGEPELPVIVVPVGLPPGISIVVSQQPSQVERFPGIAVRAVAGHDRERARRRVPDPAIYERRDAWPDPQVVAEQARVGELDLARLRIYPARFNPGSGDVELTRSLDIRVDFVDNPDDTGIRAPLSPRSVRLARQRLLNGATVLARPQRPARTATAQPDRRSPEVPDRVRMDGGSTSTRQAAVANPGVKIVVDQEGLVRVTRAELEAIGFDPLPVDPRNLQVSYRGASIPIRVTGEGDGSFDPGDVIEFYGVPGTGRYSRENVYWLEEETFTGPRFGTQDVTPAGAGAATSFPSTERYEDANTVYTFGKPAVEGEPRFFWIFFEDHPDANRVTTFQYNATLPDVDPTGSAAVLRASFLGRTDVTAVNPDQSVEFSVNGTVIGQTSWDGQTFHTAEIAFDPSLLLPGSNTFDFEYLEPFPRICYLDWFEIEHPRTLDAVGDRLTVVQDQAGNMRYDVDGLLSVNDPLVVDISNPANPALATGFSVLGTGPFTISFQPPFSGGRFLVVGDGGRISAADLVLDTPSDLSNPSNGADLIIVVPDGWESALDALRLHREAEGLRVVLTNLTDVADEFAGGNIDDLAIRDFVGFAYSSWQAPPVSHLLLVGEPNLDYLNEIGESPYYNLMPTHYGVTDVQGETMSDTWFGAVAGPDLLPEVGVGRFSVRTSMEAATLATKVIDYENNPPGGAPWGSTVLQVASDQTEFETSLQNAAQFLPQHFIVDSEYRNNGANSTSIKSALDSGAVLGSFVGHGNMTFWADSPGGPFFDRGDVAALSNAGTLPFLTALNCLNGLIGHPLELETLAERFHNLSTTGALAMWSPSSLGFLSDYDALQAILYKTIFQDGVPRIGAATQSALVETFLTEPVSIDLITELILLGDPAGWLAIDSDDDQLLDVREISAGSDPGDRDSDDDGLLDGLEGGLTTDSDGDGILNVLDPDSDDDGLPDGMESGVDVPDAGTDTTRGFFRADVQPGTMTDPFNTDSDSGGAPDGAEDRNANGMVDGIETDPNVGADDAVCSAQPLTEIARMPGEMLTLAASGNDVSLSWGDVSAQFPCVLYNLYVTDAFDGAAGKSGFSRLSTVGAASYIHVGAMSDPGDLYYLAAAVSPTHGEGPWGHFEPSAPDFLVDGGFEQWNSATDATEWLERDPGSDGSHDRSSDSFAGAYSASMVRATDAFTSFKQPAIQGLTPGSGYTLSGWFKANVSGKRVLLYLRNMTRGLTFDLDATAWLSGPGASMRLQLDTADTWTHGEQLIPIDPGFAAGDTYQVTLANNDGVGGSTWWFDEVKLTGP